MVLSRPCVHPSQVLYGEVSWMSGHLPLATLAWFSFKLSFFSVVSSLATHLMTQILPKEGDEEYSFFNIKCRSSRLL
jgi:hypothetical protein